MSPLDFYKCLAEDTRLKSLLLLAECQSLCVCELMTALNLSQPKVSRHLAELRDCGIVEGERRGRWVYYSLHAELPDWALGVLEQTGAAAKDYLQEPRARLSPNDRAVLCTTP